ncbi:hypothetical protein COBT_002724, partial [Conglomerata obtusa]
MQLLTATLCSEKPPTNITNMKPIPSQAIYDANKWSYRPNVGLDQEVDTQEKLTNSKLITNVNDIFIANERQENKVIDYTNHVYQQEKTENDRTNFYSEQKLGKKPDFTDYYPYREPCLQGSRLFQQDQENISRESCDLNNTQSESIHDKTKVWTFLKSNDSKDSSCVVSSAKNSLSTQPSAPQFDVENVLDFNNMQVTTCTHPTAPNMHKNDKKSHRNMDTYSYPYPPSANTNTDNTIEHINIQKTTCPYQPLVNVNTNNTNKHINIQKTTCPYPLSANTNTDNTIGSKSMPYNLYLHQPLGLNEGLHDNKQFNNTHVKPTPYPPAYNENFNCIGKHVHIGNEICPYPINSAENTRAMPRPITSNTNNQRNVLDNENSTANIKPDMLSNLINPQKIVLPSLPLNDSFIAKKQGCLNIRSVNQFSHAKTNFNFNDIEKNRSDKYGENISQLFLCQNQDINKQNTCPYPTENNMYTDILMSPTNSLSNPMLIQQIITDSNGPNYSTQITYEDILVNINHENILKDNYLNTPKLISTNSVDSSDHLFIGGGDKTQQKTNTDATSNMQYNIREKSPFKS